ncbi:MAG: helix-turn-helix domain-containing protein [Desulfovermiculus sp.]
MTDLKQLMEKAGLKQVDIAKKAKCSPAAVSLVVNGKSVSARIDQIIRDECKEAQMVRF